MNLFVISNTNADFKKLWHLKKLLPNSRAIDLSSESADFYSVSLNGLSNFREGLKNSLRFVKYVKAEKPNRIIYENADFAFVFISIILLFCSWRPKIIMTIHDQIPHPGKKYAFIYLYNILSILVSDAIIIYSTPDGIFKVNKRKCQVFSLGGYELDTPENLRAAVSSYDHYDGTDKVKLLLLGRGDKYKGLHLLDELLSKYPDALNNISLVIAGKKVTPYISDLVKKCPNVKIIDRYLTNQELENFIRDCNAGIMLHTKITQSGLPYEFLKNGKPLITLENSKLKSQISCNYIRHVSKTNLHDIGNIAHQLLLSSNATDIVNYYIEHHSAKKYIAQFIRY